MSPIPADRQAVLLETANTLLNARRTRTPLAELPPELRPVDLDEAYFVQDTIAVAYDDIGGYKIGAPNAQTTPMFAPMPLAWIVAGGALLCGPQWRYRGLEAEIAFQLGADLPARSTPYTREEAIAAIATCHPVVEVLESGLADPATADRFSMLGDLQMHGGLVYGPACPDWQTIDWNTETVTLAVDGTVRVERTGSNTSGDLLGLIPWLANHGAARTNGLKAGQWITTGSWTGNTPAEGGSSVDAHFHHAGRVTFEFAIDPPPVA
jgi:2-keto-4-pentenoate hydratase